MEHITPHNLMRIDSFSTCFNEKFEMTNTKFNSIAALAWIFLALTTFCICISIISVAIACTNKVIDSEIDVSSLKHFQYMKHVLIRFSALIRTILRQQHDIFVLFYRKDTLLKSKKANWKGENLRDLLIQQNSFSRWFITSNILHWNCELTKVTIKLHLIKSSEVISILSEDLVQKIKHASEFTGFFLF